jgi:hypothetical protein
MQAVVAQPSVRTSALVSSLPVGCRRDMASQLHTGRSSVTHVLVSLHFCLLSPLKIVLCVAIWDLYLLCAPGLALLVLRS